MTGGIPYSKATSGAASARNEITTLLRRFGCESVGFMDDFENCEVILAFTHRGRQMELRASAKGWAAMYVKQFPWSKHRGVSRQEYDRKALGQGQVAVNSILRDWVKGQIMAVECGILSFEAVFMPFMLMRDGSPLLKHMGNLKGLLPSPEASP